MNNKKIKVDFGNEESLEIEKGRHRILDIIPLLKNVPDDVMACKINKEMHSMYYTLKRDCKCSFVTYLEPEGKRIYSRSLIFIFLMAMYNINKDVSVNIYNKVGKHFNIGVSNVEVNEYFIKIVKEKMLEIIDSSYPIIKEKVSFTDIKEIYENMGSKQYDNFKRKLRQDYAIYNCNGYYNYLYGRLVPNTSCIKGFDLKPYKSGILLMLPREDNINVVDEKIYTNKMFDTFEQTFYSLNKITGIKFIHELNDKVLGDSICEIIRVSEAHMEKRLVNVTDKVLDKKVIMISGPSSSGKTTFSHKLQLYLKASGKNPKVISMDMYFKNASSSPVDKNGKKDFESINHFDVELFKLQIKDLLSGKEVCIPTYNFKLNGGQREYHKENTFKLKENDILIFEGIHALNPVVSDYIDNNLVYKIYIYPMVTLGYDSYTKFSSSDLRLIRRIIRDYYERGVKVENTIKFWDGVKRGEKRNIFPYVELADEIFNTYQIYEIGVLKGYIENLLLMVENVSDYYSEARRLLSLLENFRVISTDEIPSISLLCEFIPKKGCFLKS